MTLFSLSEILILTFNVFTFYVLRACDGRAFPDNTRLFYQALAVVDVIGGTTGFCMDISVLTSTELSFGVGGPFCMLFPMIYYSFFGQTLFVLCCINVDRLLTILRPMKYLQFATVKRASWALGFALVIPILLTCGLWPLPSFPATNLLRSTCGLETSDDDLADDVFFWSFLPIILSCSLTMAIVTISNVGLIIIACRQARSLGRIIPRSQNDASLNASPSPDMMRGVRTVIVITGCSYLGMCTWLFGTLVIYPRLASSPYRELFIVSGFIELSTRWWNGAIYLLTNKGFRTQAKNTFRKLCLCARL
ncbi:G-protein coupled receptor 52-like [Diadema setosum]|uniref:G-protein coupled receptor 52-like n=1 Tax=Diadema setosum TaxID=31175 RepID=UPI003B3BD450